MLNFLKRFKRASKASEEMPHDWCTHDYDYVSSFTDYDNHGLNFYKLKCFYCGTVETVDEFTFRRLAKAGQINLEGEFE